MDINEQISLLDCPVCGGPGLLEFEFNWCTYVTCCDCGCHTAEFAFEDDAGRLTAARKAADLWNMGKVISSEP